MSPGLTHPLWNFDSVTGFVTQLVALVGVIAAVTKPKE